MSPTFDDHWSQPRLFYNSLTPAEQQFLVNAIRFEASHVKSAEVRQNVLVQLNRVSHDVARRVAAALGMEAPQPDDTYYHDNVTAEVSVFGTALPTIKTLRVAVLVSVGSEASVAQAGELKERFGRDGLVVTVVGERLGEGVDQTYSAADATAYDGIVVAEGAEGLFSGNTSAAASPLFPAGRPGQVLLDGYRWGKPVGMLGRQGVALKAAGVPEGRAGVYTQMGVDEFVAEFEKGLAQFKVSFDVVF